MSVCSKFVFIFYSYANDIEYQACDQLSQKHFHYCECAYESPGDLANLQIPMQSVWSGVREAAFLTSFQTMLMLSVQRPHSLTGKGLKYITPHLPVIPNLISIIYFLLPDKMEFTVKGLSDLKKYMTLSVHMCVHTRIHVRTHTPLTFANDLTFSLRVYWFITLLPQGCNFGDKAFKKLMDFLLSALRPLCFTVKLESILMAFVSAFHRK